MEEQWTEEYPHYQPYQMTPFYTMYQKAKVGLAVVCRCCRGNSIVECLLQKRGAMSASPNKWSFPGGRLEQPGDLGDDGQVGTKRELEDGCGGGSPFGLPPLIHIECCKTGRQKQTMYHVYVVDASADKEWEEWQPKSRNSKEIVDSTPTELILCNQSFPSSHGYCWVDMCSLIEECYSLTDPNTSPLQHGLVRWVQTYGEHVLKTLIARSPKLQHSRRHTNSATPSDPLVRPRPRFNGAGKPRRYGNISLTSGGMLQPPPTAGQFYRPPFHSSASPPGGFYSIQVGQMSPTGGSLALGHQGGIVVPVPTVLSQAPGGVASASIQQQSVLPTQQSGGVAYTTQSVNLQPTNLGSRNPPTTQEGSQTPPLASVLRESPEDFVALSEANRLAIATMSAGQQSGEQIGAGLSEGQALMGLELSSRGSEDHALPEGQKQNVVATAPTAMSSQFPIGATILATSRLPGTPQPLLPNPSLVFPSPPLHSHTPSPLHSHTPSPLHPPNPSPLPSRKNVPCRHFLMGQCAYGEKCWFAHPELLSQSQTHTHEPHSYPVLSQGTGTASIQATPLHVQVPNVWMNSFPSDSTQYTSSPPHSPLAGTTLHSVPRPPAIPSVYRPIVTRAYHGFPAPPPLLMMKPSLQTARPVAAAGQPLVTPYQFPVPTDLVLKFNLLSEAAVRDEMDPAKPAQISRLVTRADHFFVSFGSSVHDYKILFGGRHSFQESATLVEKSAFQYIVTCLHCSRNQPSLLIIGTETGNVYTWDLRRGMHGSLLQVHAGEGISPQNAVSALIHFSTTIHQSQVIVVGDKQGIVSWYISQPPQKTFSLLCSKSFHVPHPVVALQILGGYLISGGQNGGVVLWSMGSQLPTVDSHVQAHSLALSDIHVLDSNHFLTVGNGSVSRTPEEPVTPPSGYPSTQPDVGSRSSSTDGLPSGVPLATAKTGSSNGHVSVDGATIVDQMSQLSMREAVQVQGVAPLGLPLHEPPTYCITLWQFDHPPRTVKTVFLIGDVISTAFHYQLHVGNMFLAVGMRDGTVKIYNVPTFSVASELHFSEMKGKDCTHIALNLSRDVPLTNTAYYRNPFRDLILTTAWSDGRVMVCQFSRN